MSGQRRAMRTPPPPPEPELLLLCCRGKLDQGGRRRLDALLGGDLDWGRVDALAGFHNLRPQLHALLSKAGWRNVPRGTADRLRSSFRRNLISNLAMTRELLRLVALLEQSAVPALPVKGPVLAAQAYDDISRRSFCDLDLMIPPASLPPAVGILRGSGYRPEIELAGPAWERFARGERCLQLRHRGHGISVELQWGMLPGYLDWPYDFHGLWQRRRAVVVERRTVPALADQDSVVFLCLHGFKHGWDRLALVSDLAHLAAAAAVDWRGMARAARSPMIGSGLLLTARLCPGIIPAAAADAIAEDGRSRRLAELFAAALTGGTPAPPGILRTGRIYLAGQRGLAGKVSYLAGLLLTPTVEDWKFWKAKPAFWPRGLLRPLRLALDHLARPMLGMRNRS